VIFFSPKTGRLSADRLALGNETQVRKRALSASFWYTGSLVIFGRLLQSLSAVRVAPTTGTSRSCSGGCLEAIEDVLFGHVALAGASTELARTSPGPVPASTPGGYARPGFLEWAGKCYREQCDVSVLCLVEGKHSGIRCFSWGRQPDAAG